MTSHRERPILMSAPMVRAILGGRKSQTRRIIKPQPTDWTTPDGPNMSAMWPAVNLRGKCAAKACPYGRIGDRLWVRETWMPRPGFETISKPHYRADNDRPEWKGLWKSSMFMPRWASRITLEVTEVRVERLQDITEENAIAEGVETWVKGRGKVWTAHESLGLNTIGRLAYRSLWNSINGAASWDKNEWVWAVSFRHGML